MKGRLYPALVIMFLMFTGLMIRPPAVAALESAVPISRELATSIASQIFPAGIELTNGKLLVTEPEVIFVNKERLALRVRLHAYDHRPEQNIALSEMGWAQVSGQLDFDPASREVLLHNPKMDDLEFDRQNEASQRFRSDISGNWSGQVANPMRTEIPPHPYIVLFKDNISNVTYDGKNIIVGIAYE